jgi:hypothetical protein
VYALRIEIDPSPSKNPENQALFLLTILLGTEEIGLTEYSLQASLNFIILLGVISLPFI